MIIFSWLRFWPTRWIFQWPKPFSGSPLCGRTIQDVVQYKWSYFWGDRTLHSDDPGFARVALNPKVGAPFYYFGQFFLKNAWKWKKKLIGGREAQVPSTVDPPMLQMVVHESDVSTNSANWLWVSSFFQWLIPVGGPRGGGEGVMALPGPVKISHKKDGCLRRPHRFHVSQSLPYPAAGSATGSSKV